MSPTSPAPVQAWRELMDRVKAADEAAKLGLDGQGSGRPERPFRVLTSDANPYPASPAMRQDGGWTGPVTDARRVRTMDGKADL